MSRIAKAPIALPDGVEFKVSERNVSVKGAKGQLNMGLPAGVELSSEDGQVNVSLETGKNSNWAMAGTVRALVNNMITGVNEGFERRLELTGVGYRAQAQGGKLNLTLGLSHPVNYDLPDDVTVETPTQTEIVLRGIDKQRVGQAAAEIRAFRPPEPYKGKGIRYSDERVIRKEAKKKA
jgi:large subunit ribosomal protein L6